VRETLQDVNPQYLDHVHPLLPEHPYGVRRFLVDVNATLWQSRGEVDVLGEMLDVVAKSQL
jgi:hypothetical protein